MSPRRRRHRIGALLGSFALALAGLTALGPAPATAADGPVAGYPYGKAVQPLAGCETNELAGNDDGYVASPVDIGFTMNYFGDAYSQLYVNNNGNVTFDGPSSTYTPFPLEDATSVPIIAPYFTDIDTRGPGRTLHYGTGTTATGQKYFCVDWVQVAQYPTNDAQGLLSFQLVLYDASGEAGADPGDVDIEFNYDTMPWDHSGNARAGFAAGNGVAGSSLELPGGGQAGKLIDGGDNALVSSSANSSQPGRYRFPIRSEEQVPTGSFTGTVTGSGNGAPVAGARVQACRENLYCRTTTSNNDGTYTVSNLRAGDYALKAFPADSSANPAHGTGTLATSTDSQRVDLQLQTPQPPPAGTTIPSQNGTTVIGGQEVPVIYWGEPHPFSFTGCVGASPAQVRFDGFDNSGAPYTSTVTAVEDPTTPGRYTATIPRFDTIGVHGSMTIHELLTCAGTPSDVSFDIYIDPSGTVVDQDGDPVAGATVTLLSSDSESGTYTPVENGSTVMSPSNRVNPDTTDTDGAYAWDVLAGFYKVRAEKAGCTGPGGASYVESGALTVPPEVTGLTLTLTCPDQPPANSAPTVSAGPDVTGATGTMIALAGSADDPDGDPLTLSWSVSSPSCTVAAPGSASTSVVCTVAGVYTATLTADDGVNAPQVDSAQVTVADDDGSATCRGMTTTPGVTVSTDPSTGVTTFTGTSGNDVIIGTSGKDVVRAGAGNDVVCAGPGDDMVYGATGNDVLRGQAGNDRVYGQAGVDTVHGNDGNDLVQGNDGNDHVLGGIGNDTVIGGKQSDVCNGGQGTDRARTCETLIGFP